MSALVEPCGLCAGRGWVDTDRGGDHAAQAIVRHECALCRGSGEQQTECAWCGDPAEDLDGGTPSCRRCQRASESDAHLAETICLLEARARMLESTPREIRRVAEMLPPESRISAELAALRACCEQQGAAFVVEIQKLRKMTDTER